MKTDAMAAEWWINDLRNFVSRCPQTAYVIRLRGLPYECTASQIIDFFWRDGACCEVLNGEDGIFFVKKRDGKATGDALVLFENEMSFSAAMTKNKQLIGVRYIELFRTSLSEAEQVVRRSLESKARPPLVRGMAQPSTMLPSYNVPDFIFGNAKDCLRFRGLPMEAQVKNVLEFMGTHAASIALHGVHMIYNSLGQPSGEALVQMNSEAEAASAAAQCNNGFMYIDQAQYFIEVCQCSGAGVTSDLAAVTSAGRIDEPAQFLPMMPPMLEPPFTPPQQYLKIPMTPPGIVYFPCNTLENPYPMPSTPEWLPEFPTSPPIWVLLTSPPEDPGHCENPDDFVDYNLRMSLAQMSVT